MYSEFSRVYDNFKCPYEKSLETYSMPLIYIYIYIQCNPNIRELSGPEKKYLISGFRLFYIH